MDNAILQRYEDFVKRTYRNKNSIFMGKTEGYTERHDKMMLGSIGLSGEAGELLEHHKKYAFHGKPMDLDAVLKELGDCLWYLTLCAHSHGYCLEDVIDANIEKLTGRMVRDEGVNKNVGG